jgi:predicted nucleic-acid-binding Zn-ribbon protein
MTISDGIMNQIKPCPECGGKNLFETDSMTAGHGPGPFLLPRLGTFFRVPRFQVRVCADCGLTRLFATKEALEKLPTANNWRKL